MARDADDRPGPVRPAVAWAFATIGFLTLLVFGLGMLSLALDEDVIATPGLGLIPGVAAAGAATVAFALTLWPGLGATRPSYWTAAWCALAAIGAYLGALWVGSVATGVGPAVATAAVGSFALSGFAAVVAGVGAVCGWSGIALVRTRARRPRWPWEGDEDE